MSAHNVELNTVAFYLPKNNETRGQWATSLTWENSSNDYIITLIKRRSKTLYIILMRIYWFFIWTNLYPLHQGMLCAKIGCNWLSGSGEEDFLISSMYFRYFVIISPWKGWGPSFEQTYIPFTKGSFVSSLVEIGSVVLEKKIFKFRQCIITFS